MKIAAILMAVLLLAGCGTSRSSDDAGSAGTPRAETEAARQQRMCQSTTIGSQSERFCY
jgi:uncharacterized protein YceK